MTRPVALRILALAAVIGVVAQALLFDTLLGVNVPLLVGAVLAAAGAIRPRERSIDRADWWLPPATIILGLAVAVRADPVLLLLDVMALCALLGATVAAISGAAVTRRSAIRIVELGFIVLGWVGIGILRATAALSRASGGSDLDSPLRRLPPWAGPVARGLVLAIPALVVFAVLFSAADLAFDQLMARLFTWDVDLGLLPLRIAIAFLIAWGVTGLLAVAAGSIVDEPGTAGSPPMQPVAQSLGAAAAGLPARVARDGEPAPLIRLGPIEAATILIAVDVLFAVFVLLQIRYLFGGQDSLAVTGLPYAQYARSGFFELVWVAFLAGGLLAVVHAIAARRTLVLVGAGIALAALTAAVLVSALIRLRIYQDAYGWTELRFYVLASIVWLGIGIAITIAFLARDRMGYLLHGLAIAAVVVLIGINIVGPSRVIAEENVARVLNPALVPPDGMTGLDVRYASALGDDAVPALIRALPALAEADRSNLLARLERRREALAASDATSWPAWNLGRELARQALAGLPGR
ncbi:MAG: DUF4173 domain-containing protein [Chloroflexi bacterium]|nr:DUF4173 domain-containing protein [Chloroflexota bacterium]